MQEQKGSSRSGPSASEDDQSDALSNDSRDSNASFERSALTSAENPEATDADHYDDTSDKTSSSSLRGPRDEGAGQRTATDRNDHEELEVRKSSVRVLSPKPTIDTNPYKPDCGHGDAHEHTSDKPEEPRRHSSRLTSRSRSAKRQSQHGPTASNPVPDPLDTAERPLTYHEELVLISSEDVLKSTRHSREQCKYVSVTLQFCIENQAPFDSHVEEIMEQFRTLNELLKQLLFFIEPFRDEHRTAIFVIEELDILTRGTRIALIMLEKGFALSDITSMNLEGRRQTWRNLMVAFQKKNPCSLSEHLKLSCRYGKELLANITAGIRSSPESNLWKSRICKTNGFRQNSTLAKSLVVDEANTEAKIDEWGRRTTLHHARLPIPVRLLSRYERSSEEIIRRVSENAHVEDVPNNQDNSSTASTLAGSKITPTGEVNWLWLCQADIIPGYWATPWKHLFPEAVCLGAISVLLKLLETFTDATNCRYMQSPPLHFLDWLRAGKSTYPSHAHNSKGGTVASGIYKSASFSAFKHAVSPIELLYSSEYQVDRSVIQTTKSVTDSICELMGLDSWLSMAGRLPEITGGPSNLLRTFRLYSSGL
jgi:hypothetical protein